MHSVSQQWECVTVFLTLRYRLPTCYLTDGLHKWDLVLFQSDTDVHKCQFIFDQYISNLNWRSIALWLLREDGHCGIQWNMPEMLHVGILCLSSDWQALIIIHFPVMFSWRSSLSEMVNSAFHRISILSESPGTRVSLQCYYLFSNLDSVDLKIFTMLWMHQLVKKLYRPTDFLITVV